MTFVSKTFLNLLKFVKTDVLDIFSRWVVPQVGGEVQGFEFCHQAVQVDKCNIKEPKLTKDKIVDSVKCLIFYQKAHPAALL